MSWKVDRSAFVLEIQEHRAADCVPGHSPPVRPVGLEVTRLCSVEKARRTGGYEETNLEQSVVCDVIS